MAADAPTNQIHTVSRLSFRRFSRKTVYIVRKIYFIVRNGQSGAKKQTKNKRFLGVASF